MKIIIAFIGVIVGFSLISWFGSSVLASEKWQNNYGHYSEIMQLSMLFWACMFILVIVGVIYLWWKKAI